MPEPLAPLTRDIGCRKDMMWATKLDLAVAPQDFTASLERHGFAEGMGAIPGRLVVYDHVASGHRLIYVPRTGRIQIRLDALTRHEDRVEAARRVYDVVRRASFDAVGPMTAGNQPAHHSPSGVG